MVIGKVVSSFPGVMYGPLYYRELESDKSLAAKTNKGNFNASMTISPEAQMELKWWVDNVECSFNVLAHVQPQYQITTDASLSGWGAVSGDVSTGGSWTYTESTHHINYLEMYAILLGLQTFDTGKNNTHIRVMCDNMTAVMVLNHMGTSHSNCCNYMTKKIWEWCIERGIWLSIAHIPGKQNFIADFESRRNQRESEWMLDKTSVLNALMELNVTPDIDLFASRISHQFTQYVAYKPDPNAFAIDAFSLDWSKLNLYAFPPFSVIPSVLSKMTAEQATGVIVVPDWPTQSWHPKVQQMLVKEPVLLEARKDLLKLPSHPSEVHPLWHKLNLLVCILSGKD